METATQTQQQQVAPKCGNVKCTCGDSCSGVDCKCGVKANCGNGCVAWPECQYQIAPSRACSSSDLGLLKQLLYSEQQKFQTQTSQQLQLEHPSEVDRQFGYVSQHPFLFSGLEANKRLCQFNWDLTDLDTLFWEQEQVLAQKNKGRDIVSGQQLVDEQILGSGPVPLRLADTRTYYDHLRRLADERRKELGLAVEYYQFFHDADNVEAYLLDTLRVFSTDDVGHDESSVQDELISKFDATSLSMLKTENSSGFKECFDRHIQQLEAQAFALPEEASVHPDIAARLSGTQQRKSDLVKVARKQRLIDSLTKYKLLSDIDSVESWIDEKGKLLKTLISGPDLEEVEIMKHRFETLQNGMQSQAAKVQTINELARQMLQALDSAPATFCSASIP